MGSEHRMKYLILLGAVILATVAWTRHWSTEFSARSTASSDQNALPSIKAASDPIIPENPGDRPWTPPDYSEQGKALGYDAHTFDVPPGLRDQVEFWKDVYTKYSSHQGVIHDSRYPNIVYEAVDLTDIYQNDGLSAWQKDHDKEQRIKLAKQTVIDRLKHLATVTDPSQLEGPELRYWNLFKDVDEPDKFTAATERNRIRFQAGQRDQFIKGIYESGRYLPQMERIFKDQGLPIELTRIAFVESSFNLNARSRVGASGIWQFMRGTARGLLRIDSSCDERNDPLSATLAAARKLRQNFQMLGTWPLAVTGYNRGSYGVRRLVKKFKTTDLADLTDVRKGRFRFASANFYTSFLAALDIEQHADRYFGPLRVRAELKGETIRLRHNLPVTKLIGWFDGDQAKAEMYNPQIRRRVWKRHRSILRRNFIRVPLDKVAEVRGDLGLPITATR